MHGSEVRPPFPTPGPPKPKQRNWALITLIGVVVVGLLVCASGGIIGYVWIQKAMREGPPKFDESVVLSQVRPLEEGWARFRIDALGFELDFPTDISSHTYDYDASDRLLVRDYFSYQGSLEYESISFEGFGFTLAGFANSRDVADWIQESYSDDPDWEEMKFDWKRTRFHGKVAAYVSGTGKYEGDAYAIEALGFLMGSRILQFEVYAATPEEAKALLTRVEKSLALDEPGPPTR